MQSKADYEIRMAALKKLTDEPALARLAKTSPSPETRITAVQKLTNQSLLADIAKTAPSGEIRVKAANKLRDHELAQKTYEYVARNDSDIRTQFEAAKRMASLSRSRNLIYQAILNASNPQDLGSFFDYLCRTDKLQFSDLLGSGLLVDTLTPHEIELFLISAMAHVDDNTLFNIATSDSVKYTLRLAAVIRIKDSNLLVEIVTTETADDRLRIDTVNRITDANSHVEFATSDTVDDTLRLAAVNRLSDKESLREIICHEDRKGVFSTKIANAAYNKMPRDANYYYEIIQDIAYGLENHPGECIFQDMLDNLTQEHYYEMSTGQMQTRFWDDRDAAETGLQRLHDIKLLCDVVINGYNDEIKELAFKKLSEMDQAALQHDTCWQECKVAHETRKSNASKDVSTP